MLSWCFEIVESLVIGTYFLKEHSPRSVFLKEGLMVPEPDLNNFVRGYFA
jgi:hypothetical protein